MILVVCTDDDKLLGVARQQSLSHPATFGKCYQVFHDKVPSLASDEDLFVSAHGAYKGDDGNPVIGDAKAALFVNAVQFWQQIEECVPKDFRARVFISACESADHGGADFSFAEVFETQIHAARKYAGHVYGQKGSVGLKVPAPNDSGWVQVTSLAA